MKRRFSVIPRRPESSSFKLLQIFWIPVSTGVTTFYEAINLKFMKFLSKGKPTLCLEYTKLAMVSQGE
jgi:hypothetical protein